jgi:CRISPR-associated protein Cas2
MLTVVSYDIPDDRRRTRLAHALKDFGERVQYSVFECRLTDDQVDLLRESVLREIEAEEDRVRVYRFCADCGAKTELFGLGTLTEDPEVYIL